MRRGSVRENFSSFKSFLIHMPSRIPHANALNSASTLLLAMTLCFLLRQVTNSLQQRSSNQKWIFYQWCFLPNQHQCTLQHSASTILDEKQKDGLGSTNDGFYESKRDWLGRCHIILAFESSVPGMYKIIRPAVGESLREMSLSELRNKYRKTSSLEKARNGWEDEYDISSKQCMHGPKCKLGNFCTVGRRIQEVNVLGGLILPVWGTIENALSKQARQSHQRLRVVRIETTTDKQRIVGLFVPNAAVESVLRGLAWVQDVDD